MREAAALCKTAKVRCLSVAKERNGQNNGQEFAGRCFSLSGSDDARNCEYDTFTEAHVIV